MSRVHAFFVRLQCFARSASLSGTHYALKEQFTFMIQTIRTAELQKKRKKRGKRKLLLQIRLSWTREHFESHRLSVQMFGILPRH